MTTWDKWAVAIILALLAVLSLQRNAHSFVYAACSEWYPWAINAQAHNAEMYVIAHGYYDGYYRDCGGWDFVPASTLPHSNFAFYTVCDGLCEVGEGRFSDSASQVISYCHLDAPQCLTCFYNYSMPFQDAVYRGMEQGKTVKQSFDSAIAQYPACNGCAKYFDNRPHEIVRDILAPLLLQ